MDKIIIYAIELVLAIVAFLLGRYVFPAVKQYFSELNNDNVSTIASWVYKFVVSAKNQFEDGCGEQKLAYVTEQVSAFCERNNITLTSEQIRALIEDAYVLMKQNYNEA
jgi:LL-H family phage holin